MIGPKIERRMAEVGIKTQTDLAERAGLSVQYVNALVRGKRGKRMGYQVQKKLARALRVRLIFFEADPTDVEKASGDHAPVDLQAGERCPI